MDRITAGDVIAGIAIVAALIFVGVYCVFLNQMFYLTHGPFWDSVSYDDLLARVMLAVRAGETVTGFALIYTSTVALPWLEAILVAPFVEPSRSVGVWIQVTWMMVTGLIAYIYFRRIVGYARVTAVCCALTFFFIARTFKWDGSVSDFRLDYLQFLLFSIACLLYLMASAEDRLGGWALWGGALGLACLGRATTPVYAILVFGPFFLIDLWRHRIAPWPVIQRYMQGVGWCALVSAWFFITNFSHLYFYYAIWNWDAAASLPLSVSARHAAFLFDHIGPVAFIAYLAVFGVNVTAWCSGTGAGRWNLRALWCGVAPLGFLILSGAGLNPYPSEIAVFGVVMFLVAPVTAPAGLPWPRLRMLSAAVALLITAAAGIVDGLDEHSDLTDRYVPPNILGRKALAAVSRCMTDDVGLEQSGILTYSVLYSGMLNSEVIMNSLVFDDRHSAELRPDGLLAVHIGQAILTAAPFRADKLVTPVQWDVVPGTDDEQKIDNIAREISQQADYVILPSVDSMLPNGTIDAYANRIGERLAMIVPLRLLCQHVPVGPHEFATIYRNEGGRTTAELP